MSEQLYYEAHKCGDSWEWRIYKYDISGNRRIDVRRSKHFYDTAMEALDACVEFMDDENMDATLG